VPDQAIATEYTTPASGTSAWWTSSADDLNTTLTRSLDLTGISKATVTAKAWYDIEAGFDYLYAEYKPAGGDWTQIGSPIDGSTNGKWSTLRLTVPGNGPVDFRFRYQTDGGVHLAGAFIDDIVVKNGGATLLTDDVEAGTNGWTAAGGFKISTGTETSSGDRYYLAENRTYVGYDATLEVGPYQFSKGITAPDFVEHFPFQDGLLVWAIDETYGDNNTIEHPGHGQALPVDARPARFGYGDGTYPSNRRQPFDATFGLQATDAVSLHKEVVVGNGPNQTVQTLAATAPSVPGIPTFTDAVPGAYYDASNPLGSVLVAGHGVTVTVTNQVTGGDMTVDVTNPQ
jgi:immune inhibitor A